MIDLHLRADTAEALREALPWLWDAEASVWITGTADHAFDPIGAVVTDPGEVDDEGEVIVPPTIDGRFHANLRCTAEIAAGVPAGLLVEPETPVRIWA